MRSSEEANPFQAIVNGWLGVIEQCNKVKRQAFGEDADEAMRFFNGPYNFTWDKRYSAIAADDQDNKSASPSFKMTVNKTAEVVQIFGPTLYHRNPNRKVTPLPLVSIMDIIPPELQQDPEFMQVIQLEQATMPKLQFQRKVQSLLMERYLNYTPNELNLKDNIRMAVDEALIKGMGVLWTETWSDPLDRQTLVGSFYDTVDNLLIDPDAETIEDAMFIIRRRMSPVWEVADRFGLDEKELKGNIESWTAQGSTSGTDGEHYKRASGKANDCVYYYEIYSKMGAGHLLNNVSTELKKTFDMLGKYVYLVIAPGIEFPLNLSKKKLKAAKSDKDLLTATEWPIPFWEDGTWPFTPIIFHTIPRSPWPQSHMKPAMGEMKFLNWAYSFVASKIGTTSRDLMACAKSLSEETKEAILYGKDLELIELEDMSGKKIEEVISFIQHPQFNGDIWHVIAAVEANFEKRVGLNELSYGNSTKQIRVAADAEIKQQAGQVRPQDMANKVEDAATALARKEGIAARWLITKEDVEPIIGPAAAALWETWIQNSDISRVAMELEYRVEAGQARKPNKEQVVQNMQTAIQQILPALIETGNFQAANALIQDWAKSIDIMEPERYTMQPPPPPPPDPKAELIQVELQAKLAETQAKLQADGVKTQMKIEHGKQKMVQDSEEHKAAMSQIADKGHMDMLSKLLNATTDVQISKEKSATDVQISKEKSTTDQVIKLKEQETNAKIEKSKAKSKPKKK